MRRRQAFRQQYLEQEAARVSRETSRVETISYECDHCHQPFKTEHGLKVHMARKHK